MLKVFVHPVPLVVPSLSFLGYLAVRPVGQFLGLGKKVKSLVQLGIAFKEDAARVTHAKLVVENFVLNRAFQVVAVVVELLVRELNPALRDVLLELVDYCIGNLERGFTDRRVLGKVIANERIHAELCREVGLKIVDLRFFHNVVGRDTTTAVNDTAGVGVLDVVFLRRGRFTMIVIIELRNLRIVALDQTAARRVPLLSSQRET